MRIPLLHAFRSLRIRNFRVWAAGAFVSNIGTWMQRVAQDWLVLTQLTHHDASALGTVMALQFAPQFLFLPWTGAAADRMDQRRLMVFTNAAMGMLSLLLGVLTIAGSVTLFEVYVLAFLSGSAAALDAPVRQTFVAELVGDESLPNAVALNSTSFNAGGMIGPAVAGLVIAAVGTGWTFVFNGLSFAAMLLAMALLRTSELKPAKRAARRAGAFREGLRYVRGRADLCAILLMLFLFGTFGLNFPIFISTMAVRVFHTDARGFGLLSSLMAIGTISGSLLAASRERPQMQTLLLSAAGFGAACMLGAVAPGYWTFGAALALMGVAALTFTNGTNSMMQLGTEPSMRGRVMALRVGIALGGTPIGAPITGWVVNRFGPRWSLGVGAAAGCSAALVAVFAARKQARVAAALQNSHAPISPGH